MSCPDLKVWAENGTKQQPSDAEIEAGFSACSNPKPSPSVMNWLLNMVTCNLDQLANFTVFANDPIVGDGTQTNPLDVDFNKLSDADITAICTKLLDDQDCADAIAALSTGGGGSNGPIVQVTYQGTLTIGDAYFDSFKYVTSATTINTGVGVQSFFSSSNINVTQILNLSDGSTPSTFNLPAGSFIFVKERLPEGGAGGGGM